jgi:hypothetical protein
VRHLSNSRKSGVHYSMSFSGARRPCASKQAGNSTKGMEIAEHRLSIIGEPLSSLTYLFPERIALGTEGLGLIFRATR